MAKVALDIVLLADSDIGELAERADGAGGSSSMAHKHNPIAAISARAAAMQVPGLVSTLLHAAGSHELERAAGAWHAEWPALNQLLRATGSAVDWLQTSLDAPRRRPGPDGRQPGPQRGGAVVTDDRYEAGMRVRREVLGDEHVDRATAARRRARRRLPALHHRERVGLAVDPRRPPRPADPLVRHDRRAHRAAGDRRAGPAHPRRSAQRPDAEEIVEVIMHTAGYAGIPAANSAIAVAKQVARPTILSPRSREREDSGNRDGAASPSP